MPTKRGAAIAFEVAGKLYVIGGAALHPGTADVYAHLSCSGTFYLTAQQEWSHKLAFLTMYVALFIGAHVLARWARRARARQAIALTPPRPRALPAQVVRQGWLGLRLRPASVVRPRVQRVP